MRIVILCVILLLLVLLSCACVERIPKCPRIPQDNDGTPSSSSSHGS